jgi:enterochelin esterase-like enzyme
VLPPYGDGLGVVLIPPFITRREIMTPIMEHWLQLFGYDVEHPNIRMQTECPWTTCTKKILPCIKELYERTGQRVVLIGWSKGGYEAAWLANKYPRYVAMAVTIASPQVCAYPIAGVGLHTVTCGKIRQCAFPKVATRLPRGTRIVNIVPTKDRLVPPKHGAIKGNEHVHRVEGAGHLSVVFKPRLYEILAMELETCLEDEAARAA